MKTLRALIALPLLSGLALLPVACGEDPISSEDEDVVPEDAETTFDQVGVCDAMFKRHVGIRERDLENGTVSWGCGDVKGVDGEDRGQEYCEYHAVSRGEVVTSASDLEAGEKLYCYFTSVYYDVDGTDGKDGYVGDRDRALAAELSKPENLGATVAPELVRMKLQFNARSAATTLIQDCEALKPSLDEQRQVACYMAGLEKDAAKLKEACRGKDLSKAANWKKAQDLGAKVYEPGDDEFEVQQDLVGCAAVRRAQHGGLAFRNSDPRICSHVYRANEECQCSWSELPEALDGFEFTTWTSDEALPVGCRRVKVGGADSMQLALCEVSADEASELALDGNYAEDLDAFCNDRFGKDMVMRAPLRAVEKSGSCKDEGEGQFCADFVIEAGTGDGGGGAGGATSTGTTTGTTGSTSTGEGGGTTGSTSTGGGSTCAHDECTAGAALTSGCSACATAVCATDDFCCTTEWDSTCVGLVGTTPACADAGVSCN
jgi:hypothetical protein